jgi:hypothetical protein
MYFPGLSLNILLQYHPPAAIVLITVPPKFLHLPHYTHLKCKSKTAYYCIGKKYTTYVQIGDLFVTVHNIFNIHESYDTASRYITITKPWLL